MNESGKYKIGYTAGAFDMFHVGHLNLLRQAKERCDMLIVGVNSDDLIREYKNKETVIKEADRLAIVSSIRFVDKAVLATTLDKVDAFEKYHFDVLLIGNDWKGNPRWTKTEEEMRERNVDVIYLSRTEGISSTELRDKLEKMDRA